MERLSNELEQIAYRMANALDRAERIEMCARGLLDAINALPDGKQISRELDRQVRQLCEALKE